MRDLINYSFRKKLTLQDGLKTKTWQLILVSVQKYCPINLLVDLRWIIYDPWLHNNIGSSRLFVYTRWMGRFTLTRLMAVINYSFIDMNDVLMFNAEGIRTLMRHYFWKHTILVLELITAMIYYALNNNFSSDLKFK